MWGNKPCGFFHGSLQFRSRPMLRAASRVRWPGPLTDGPGEGIVCLPSVPAQLEVINTGNLIQRQETPLPPTEFKLNALLFFFAKSRFALLNPAEPHTTWPSGAVNVVTSITQPEDGPEPVTTKDSGLELPLWALYLRLEAPNFPIGADSLSVEEGL
ncbi:hypothetical protein EYF80_013946 [Liparis tanakae]|uniref:Uncharacterized protein n=1 Tax=Liparis tanakae TaxID=230148 RepID=A0A4Z2ICJ9_9TELE|nr:hypothetical protein EYF80_013946 [Liparis tanakae]